MGPAEGAVVINLLEVEPASWDELEASLTAAFEQMKEARLAERAVVAIVSEPALWGHSDPLVAMMATGILGGVRSFAVEGARIGLSGIVVSADEQTPAELIEDTATLLVRSAASGAVIHLGACHRGRPPV